MTIIVVIQRFLLLFFKYVTSNKYILFTIHFANHVKCLNKLFEQGK